MVSDRLVIGHDGAERASRLLALFDLAWELNKGNLRPIRSQKFLGENDPAPKVREARAKNLNYFLDSNPPTVLRYHHHDHMAGSLTKQTNNLF